MNGVYVCHVLDAVAAVSSQKTLGLRACMRNATSEDHHLMQPFYYPISTNL